MRLTRRHVLAASALVAGGSLLGVGITATRWWDQPAGAGMRSLSVDEAAFLDAFVEAAAPAGGVPALGGGSAGVSAAVDLVLAAMEPIQRDLLKLALHALDASTLPTHGAAFRDLPVAPASVVVEGWMRSEIAELRGVSASLYVFTMGAYLVHPDVAPMLSAWSRCGLSR